MSTGKYTWPSPVGEVHHWPQPVPVRIDLVPFVGLSLAPTIVEGEALAWAAGPNAIRRQVVLCRFTAGGKTVEKWVWADLVERAST